MDKKDNQNIMSVLEKKKNHQAQTDTEAEAP